MEAVIYTRVSTDHSQGRSVADQEKECRAVCERNGWPIRKVFTDDAISASRFARTERAAWGDLKAELRQGDVLVTWEASRAGRDLEEFVALRNLCAELQVPLSYSGRVLDLTLGDDRFVGGLDALLAERESEMTKVRVLRGKRTAAVAGRPAGPPPWGYRVTGRAEWGHDPVEAPRVREAVARILAGETRYSVFEWLRITPGWTPASSTTLRNALRNPALAGLRVHQKEVVGKGTWEPIITEEQHNQLVADDEVRMMTRGYTERPGPEPLYLLSGIALCGVCENKEGVRHKAHSNRKRNPQYECYRGHVSRVASMVDLIVERKVFEELAKENPDKFNTEDPRVALAVEEMKELKKKLKEWQDLADADEVSPASFARFEKNLRARMDELKPRMVSRKRKLPFTVEELEAAWPHMTMRQKREVVRLFDVRILPVGRGRREDVDGVTVEPRFAPL